MHSLTSTRWKVVLTPVGLSSPVVELAMLGVIAAHSVGHQVQLVVGHAGDAWRPFVWVRTERMCSDWGAGIEEAQIVAGRFHIVGEHQEALVVVAALLRSARPTENEGVLEMESAAQW